MAKDRTVYFPYCNKTQERQQFVSVSLKILSKIIIKWKGGRFEIHPCCQLPMMRNYRYLADVIFITAPRMIVLHVIKFQIQIRSNDGAFKKFATFGDFQTPKDLNPPYFHSQLAEWHILEHMFILNNVADTSSITCLLMDGGVGEYQKTPTIKIVVGNLLPETF